MKVVSDSAIMNWLWWFLFWPPHLLKKARKQRSAGIYRRAYKQTFHHLGLLYFLWILSPSLSHFILYWLVLQAIHSFISTIALRHDVFAFSIVLLWLWPIEKTSVCLFFYAIKLFYYAVLCMLRYSGLYPGLKVLTPYSSEDARGLLKAALRSYPHRLLIWCHFNHLSIHNQCFC